MLRNLEGEDAAETPKHHGVPKPLVIKELARQVGNWRDLLPAPLRWSDEFPGQVSRIQESPTNVELSTGNASTAPLSVPQPCEIIHCVLTARLRTRFYHIKYSMYRPYIYKVLHFPETTSANDIENCVLCLKVPYIPFPFLHLQPISK
jgi:hypothetical protein